MSGLTKIYAAQRAVVPLASEAIRRGTTRRAFATHSSYEYPLRTESPTVTRSKASDLSTSAIQPSLRDKSRLPPGSADPFDDAASLPESSRSKLLEKQKVEIRTELDPRHKIMPSPPGHIPRNVPVDQLVTPTTQITTLENGIRVASQETYGQVSTLGLLSATGSRHETNENTGVNHMLELLAFQSTEKFTASEIMTKLDLLGGATFANSSREQFLYCVDILRPNANEGMEILADTVRRPRITDADVEEMKKVIEYQWLDLVPEVRVGEGLQMAGYSGGKGEEQLGRAHFCPLEALPNLTAKAVLDFRNANLLNPEGIVIAGAGIGHEELVSLSESLFGDIPKEGSSGKVETVPSKYTGGEFRLNTPTVDGFNRVALAFEVGGWHSDDLVPTCVLQTLLGGGNSFSAGGPGKGMYSRLYREVLNRYYWAESAEAFTSFHGESGLLGISGSSVPAKSRDVTRVLAEHFARLALDLVTDEELDRARNMLKCNVLTQLESRLVLFEDIGRQILTYGKREDTESMCTKIDAVTKEDIRDIARRAIGKAPTLSTVGDDVGGVPSHEEIVGWFKH